MEDLKTQQQILPKRKHLLDADKTESYFNKLNVPLLSNNYRIQLKSEKVKIHLFSVSINLNEINEKDNFLRIEYILKDKQIKNKLKTFFKNFYIMSSVIYVVSDSEILEDRYDFQIYSSLKELRFPKDDDERNHIYLVELRKKKVFNKNHINNDEDKKHLSLFYNRYIKQLLGEINYFQSDPLQKNVYYSKDCDKIEVIRNQIFFVYGYKVTVNSFDFDHLQLKVFQKFRLQRETTYLDWMNEEKSRKNLSDEKFYHYFESKIQGRKGLTYYNNRAWKINGIDYLKTPETHIIRVDGDREINLLTYYLEKYKIKIKYKQQPLFYNLKISNNGMENGETKVITYLVPELIKVVGTMDQRENFAKSTLISPKEKYDKTHNLVKNLESTKKQDMFVEGLDITECDLKSYVLVQPEIHFGNKQIAEVNHKGVFDVENKLPLFSKDETVESWYLIYPLEEKERCAEVLSTLTATPNFDKFFIQKPKTIKLNQKEYNINNFADYLEELLKRSDIKETKIALIMMTLEFKKKNLYNQFKNVLNKFKLPSQVIILENFEKKRNQIGPVCTKIFFGMISKCGCDVWYPTVVNPKIQKCTMVVGYSVLKRDQDSMITVLSIYLSYKMISNIFLQAEQEYNSTSTSTTIHELMLKAVKMYKKVNGNFPTNIMIYREGVTKDMRNLIVNNELNEIKSIISEYVIQQKETIQIKYIFIFVNKFSEQKFYLQNNSMDSSFASAYSSSKSSRYQNESITNIPPGTLVESVVTSNSYWEFYLNSTSTPVQGTSSPTNYIIGYDDTSLSAIFVYIFTYFLTFKYHNNNNCVRIPAPLQNASRMANFCVKYLDKNNPNRIDKISNYSL